MATHVVRLIHTHVWLDHKQRCVGSVSISRKRWVLRAVRPQAVVPWVVVPQAVGSLGSTAASDGSVTISPQATAGEEANGKHCYLSTRAASGSGGGGSEAVMFMAPPPLPHAEGGGG